MDEAVSRKLVYQTAPMEGSRWLTLFTHYADSYDAIGYGIINPVVEGYIAEHYDISEVESAVKYDEICGEMVRTLWRQEKSALLEVYLYNTWKGFVNSIALANPVLSLYAAAAYLGMGILAWYLCILLKRQKCSLSRLSERKSEMPVQEA